MDRISATGSGTAPVSEAEGRSEAPSADAASTGAARVRHGRRTRSRAEARSASAQSSPGGGVAEPGSGSLAELLAEVRRRRFGDGVRCPHCDGERVQRWGTFGGGRQRYRCRDGCGRTFSDLTGTPAAYLKKVELLEAYGECMSEGTSLVEAATRLGIHVSTAFRWRHRFCAGLMAHDDVGLEGWVEFGWQRFAHSEKGSRRLARASRRRGVRIGRWIEQRRVSAMVACDRKGGVVTARMPGHSAELWPVLEILEERVGGKPALVGERWHRLVLSQVARRLGGTFHAVLRVGPEWRPIEEDGVGVAQAADARRAVWGTEGGSPHLWTVTAYQAGLKRWMRRFRGVATKYLANYLLWHRMLGAAAADATEPTLLCWPVG